MEFWVVPNAQGLPTVDAAAIVKAGGGASSVGKGAWVEKDNGQSIPINVITPLIDYDEIFLDELNFLGPDNDGFTIPDVDPPITRVLLSGKTTWNPGGTVDTARDFRMLLNGSSGDFPPDASNFLPNYRGYTNPAAQAITMSITSGAIVVTADDFLQLAVTNFDIAARNIGGNNFFSIVVLA